MMPTDRHAAPPPTGVGGKRPLKDSEGLTIHTHDAHHARHGHPDHDGLYNEDVAHEEADVNIRQLMLYTAGLVVMSLISAAIVFALFNLFESQAVKNDPVLPPQAIPAGQLPPEPRLVLNEPQILEKHRETEAEVLEKYGWVNQAAGVARVPIDEAKKLLLHKGLPVRAGAPADPWLGTHSPAHGESSSGRRIPVKPGPIAAPAGTTPTPHAAERKAPPAEHKGGF
ncbi:MAG: hypothetical protein ABIS06_12850 [Vicinamibacterales bacterium]